MPAVLKVLDDVDHGLRVLRQHQLLLPVLRDLKDLEDGCEEFDNEEDDQN